MPKGGEITRIPIRSECKEVNGKLNYTIFSDSRTDSLRIENSQYLHLEITYNGEPLIIPGSQLYILYAGNNYYFTGK